MTDHADKKNNFTNADKEEAKEEIKAEAEEQKKECDCADLEAKYKRALADYQNLLKQTAKDKQEFAKYANEQLLLEIIPVYDHLKMAFSHIDEKNHDSWQEGLKYILKQFKDVLGNLGVEEIKTIGEKFDHNTMEAIEKGEGKGDKVKKELKAGYKLNGKVIVPAKVVLE